MKRNMFLYYPAMQRFRQQFYKDLLMDEHLEPGKKHFKTLTERRSGETNKNADYWAFELVKGGEKYLVDFGDDNPLKVLPIIVQDSDEVAAGRDAYHRVRRYGKARFTPKKRMEFRELVDLFCGHGHTHPKHQKLLWLLALNQYLNRAYFRVCSPPGSGKDSTVATLRDIVGKCYSLNSPSAAKLFLRTNAKWLVINEVADIEKKDWRIISQFLFDAADDKTTIEKSTRAFGGVGETLDVSDLSISVFYNDIQAYEDKDNYFDKITTDAIKDRFCPIRVYGRFTESWNEIHRINYQKEVDQNHDFYKDIIYTLHYYKEHQEQEYKRYSHDLLLQMLPDLSGRHLKSLTLLLNTADLYAQSQEEFNAWITVIVGAIHDYYDMLRHDELVRFAYGKLKKDWEQIEAEINAMDTYTAKNRHLEKLLKPKDLKGVKSDIVVW